MAVHFGKDDAEVETHEINVTPFIDVILVLLIIFMVAAPLATVDIPVDLPGSTVQPRQRREGSLEQRPRVGELAIGEDAVSRESLASALEVATKNNKDERIFVRADRAVSYGDVMEVMNTLRSAGYLKLGLVGLEMREEKK